MGAVRRLVLACAILLAVAPAAQARSFEAESIRGTFTFRAVPDGQAQVSIDSIGPGTRIVGPLTLRGVYCVDETLELSDCVTLRRKPRQTVWTVIRPVSLVHTGVGRFALSLQRAVDVRGVFVSGCGEVRVAGTGSYSADDADVVSYTPSDTTVVVTLEP